MPHGKVMPADVAKRLMSQMDVHVQLGVRHQVIAARHLVPPLSCFTPRQTNIECPSSASGHFRHQTA
ncbi:MAG TPA: hypothetical protein VGM62_05620, partial [Chthoniobacterales bacterium]